MRWWETYLSLAPFFSLLCDLGFFTLELWHLSFSLCLSVAGRRKRGAVIIIIIIIVVIIIAVVVSVAICPTTLVGRCKS